MCNSEWYGHVPYECHFLQKYILDHYCTVHIFKNIGKFSSKNAGFLKKPNFYLLVFTYIMKFSNLTTYLERVDEFY